HRHLHIDDRPCIRDQQRADDEQEQSERDRLDARNLTAVVAPVEAHRNFSTRTTTVRSITSKPTSESIAGPRKRGFTAWTETVTVSELERSQMNCTRLA